MRNMEVKDSSVDKNINIPKMRYIVFIFVILYVSVCTIIMIMYESVSHFDQFSLLLHLHRRTEVFSPKLDNISLFYGMDIDRIMEKSLYGQKPGQYLSQYHNPCWFSKVKSGGQELQCLPKAYIIGMIKSGTTDLKQSFRIHEDILVPTRGRSKEIMWWNMFRFQFDDKNKLQTMEDYVNLMRKEINITEKVKERDGVHRKIILDPTATHAHSYRHWREIPGNKGLTEPKYLMPHSLHALVPKAQIIVIMRNPTARLLSHFRMCMHDHIENVKSNPHYFNESVVGALNQFRNCTTYHSLRACAYDTEITSSESKTCTFLSIGLYHVFLKDWLAVFPRNQFLFIRAEDYYKNRTEYLRQAFQFLDLRPIPLKREVKNEKRGGTLSGAWGSYRMWNETKDLLNDFYKEHNHLLAELLESNKWSWSD